MPSTIKRIVDCKFENGQQFYLVKWNASWEPADELEPLYKTAVDDFWDYIDTCKNAIDGKPTPAKKRKIEQVYSQRPAVSSAAPGTPEQRKHIALPTTPTTSHHQQIGISSTQLQNPRYQQQQATFPGPTQSQNQQHHQPQLQMPELQQQNMQFPPQVPNSPTASSPGRVRGSGRGRGRGRGSRGGRGGRVKQEPDAHMIYTSVGLPLPQFPISTMATFGMMPLMNPDLNNKTPSAFNFDNVRSPTSMSAMQTDVKPVLMPDGQIMSPMMAQQAMDAAMGALSPTKSKYMKSTRGAPSSRGQGGGRGRGRGNAANLAGVFVKEEKPSTESMSAEEVNGNQNNSNQNNSNKGAPNLLSGDSQYDNWSNPYANLVLVCRQCSREQNPKSRSSWKAHYESHLDIKNFGCYHCEKRFRMKGDLKTHVTRVHKQEFIDEMVIRFNDVPEVPTVDPAETIDGWVNPYVRNIFQCKLCQRELQWKSRSAWKSHYESHLDIKRFGCYVCEKQFRMKGDLKTHITRVHKVEFEDHLVIKLDMPGGQQLDS